GGSGTVAAWLWGQTAAGSCGVSARRTASRRRTTGEAHRRARDPRGGLEAQHQPALAPTREEAVPARRWRRSPRRFRGVHVSRQSRAAVAQSSDRPVSLPGWAVRPGAAVALLAALAAAALLAQHLAGVALVALLLFAVCLRA